MLNLQMDVSKGDVKTFSSSEFTLVCMREETCTKIP
jgi:hypothetical protein